MPTIHVPADRLGVPVDEFAAMLNLAGQRRQADPGSVYTGAVLAALQWVAGIRDEDPLTGRHRPAVRSAQLQVRVAAGALTMGLPDPVFGTTEPTSPEWARGVEAALQWVVGANPAAGRPAAPPPLRSLANTSEPPRIRE